MDDEAEAAREYQRLRAELADFVLDALAERIAAGQQPQLSQALVDAIDRRVEQAVAARVGNAEWPDPDAFADSVIAAAVGHGAPPRREGAGAAPRRSSEGKSPRGSAARTRRLTAGQIGLIALLGIAILAIGAFFVLRAWNAVPADTVVMNVQTNTLDATPDGAANPQQPPGNVAAAPTSAGAVENVQEPPR